MPNPAPPSRTRYGLVFFAVLVAVNAIVDSPGQAGPLWDKAEALWSA